MVSQDREVPSSLDDPKLLFRRPAPPTRLYGNQFNPLIDLRHRHGLEDIPKPSYAGCPVETGASSASGGVVPLYQGGTMGNWRLELSRSLATMRRGWIAGRESKAHGLPLNSRLRAHNVFEVPL